MEDLMSMVNALGGMLGERDILTGERLQLAPLTAVQRQLWRAVTTGGADDVQAVLAANPGMDLNFSHEDMGFTPLHMAALHNQARVAALLLEAGGGVDLRSPNTREPPLVVAACYGHVDVIRVLLRHGANPHLTDWSGTTAAQRAQARVHMGPQYAEALRLVQEAASATSPLSRAAKKEGGCGGCGRTEGVKLSVCSRCGLRSYCSRECQVRDFPQHKQRCKAVGEFKQQLALLADTNGSVDGRRRVMKRLERDAAACRMALDLKGVKLLLEALPSDRPHVMECVGPVPQETRILALCGLRSLLTEREAPLPLPPYAQMPYTARDAMQQFASARGTEVVLERILAADCPPLERIQGMRLVSALCQGFQEQLVPRHVVRKGQAEAIVKLLARLMMEHGHVNAIFTHGCICLASLALQEGPSFEELSRQASSSGGASSSSGSSSSASRAQQEELWPVSRLIFEHVDLKAVGCRLYTANHGISVAATELLAVLSRSRPAFERLMADQLICRRLVNAFYADLFMASPVGYGLALEWWDVAHRHRPGLLVEHWDEVQGVVEEISRPDEAGDAPWFVRTVLDPIDAQQPVERAQQGTFISSRHALKAARLLAHVMSAPQPLPANLLGQFVELMPDIAGGPAGDLLVLCTCKDAEAVAVLQGGLAALMPRIQDVLAALDAADSSVDSGAGGRGSGSSSGNGGKPRKKKVVRR